MFISDPDTIGKSPAASSVGDLPVVPLDRPALLSQHAIGEAHPRAAGASQNGSGVLGALPETSDPRMRRERIGFITLAGWRQLAHLTQTGLARKVGCATSKVTAWERGTPVPAEYRQHLVGLLHIPLGEEPWDTSDIWTQNPRPQPRHGFSGNALRSARVAKGLTVEQASREAGVSTDAWLEWETGISTPNGENLAPAASAVEIARDDLFEKAPQSIGEWRYRAGLTQADVAKEFQRRGSRIGGSRDTVASWEAGGAVPLQSQEILRDILGIPPGEEPWERRYPTALAEWREMAQLTQEQLGQQLGGVAAETMCLWEAGPERIPAAYRPALAKTLSIPPGREPWNDPAGIAERNAFGSLLRGLRHNAGLTQRQLAEKIGAYKEKLTARFFESCA